MEKIKRRIFFWTLVLLFFVIAPVVIMNARGYRFDTSRGVFVYSGTITLKTNPQNIQMKLNNKEIDSAKLDRINNSHNLTGLLPGDYNIEISAPGFSTWSKKTDVHSGLSSEFWNVILVRQNYTRTEYPGTEDTSGFYVSPKNSSVALAKDLGNNLEVNIMDINSKSIKNTFTFPTWNLVSEEKKENIYKTLLDKEEEKVY